MGNQLVGIAPSQILPVEQYLTDHHDLRFEISLGSTRFFKVARAKSQEGHIVVKVFAIQDPSLPLNAHKEKLEKIRSTLLMAPNCLAFRHIVLTEKAGLIMREFVKSSLYDRISTRPFLSVLEKKFITFQVLYALYQCHKLGVCHGDIKLENIMLTSWNFVLLTDFASFKPTFLPEDNPADYNYFFDTSRRRLCYVAPERFVKTLGMDNFTKIVPGEDKLGGGLLLNESPCRAGELLPSMDIFSAGCALVELWNDGTPAWDLQGLLAYRSSDAPHSIKLPKHCDPRLVDLLTSMTQKNPQLRKSAEVYLDDERGKLFPLYFYHFLQPYTQLFSRPPGNPTDDKIATMHNDISSIIDMFVNDKNAKEDKPETNIEMDFDDRNANAKVKNSLKFRTIDASKRVNISDFKFDPNLYKNRKCNNPDCEVLVIITSLVTSCIRGLHHCTSKLNSLDILLQLAKYLSAENILDRILPYLLYLTHDPLPRVRVAALNTLTKCLYMIDDLPKSDINVFPEYIFVDIAKLATDPAVSVRVAYANNIAILAETALRFLDQTQNLDNPKEAAKINYEAELTTLHGLVRQTVSSLLTDSQTIVRRVFIESGITKLCVFFGKQKANDVLLSHMITFLNDKEDTALRGSFFDCIVGVAAYVGWHCSHILVPLLQQGLTDQSEFITAKSLRATTSLAELGLIQKPSLCKLIAETVCYLSHPNLWIRHETCGLISCVARLLNPIDVNCKILPLVWPYLNYQLTQIDKTELLLESMKPAIPRPIFDSVIRYKDINQLLQTLRERKIARTKIKPGTVLYDCEMGTPLTNLFKRLDSDGLTEQIESQILKMSAHLIEMQGSKVPMNTINSSSESRGKLCISGITCISRMVPLDTVPMETNSNQNSQIGSKDLFKKPYKTHQPATENQSHMNSEWRTMFGDNKNGNDASRDLNENMANMNLNPSTHNLTSGFPSTSYCTVSNVGSQYTLRSPSPNPLDSISSEISVIADAQCQEKSFVHFQLVGSEAPCHQDLKTLTKRQQMKYARTLRSRECAIESCGTNLPPQDWKPGNALMAQLHEHRGPINRLVNLSVGTNHKSHATNGLFGSCSNDGSIRLWDLGKMEGVNIVNKSKSWFNRGAGPIIALAPCQDNLSLVAAANDSVFVLRVDPASGKLLLFEGRQLDMTEDGGVVDVICNTKYTGGNNIIVFSTLYGGIIGWDLRAHGHAWKLQGDLNHGVYTCMYASGQEWLAVGTSRGIINAWDLRFNLPITTIRHPKESRIRHIKPHPREDSFIICTTGNEANVWSLESAQRQSVLWPSDKPPLTYTVPSSHQINALYTGIVDNNSFVLTGGSDQRVRYWNLDHPELSSILINDQFVSNKTSVSYRSRLIDATTVIQEVATAHTSTVPFYPDEQVSKCIPEPKGVHHTSSVTDLTIVQAKKCYWLSATADGIINVWK